MYYLYICIICIYIFVYMYYLELQLFVFQSKVHIYFIHLFIDRKKILLFSIYMMNMQCETLAVKG